MPSPRFDKQEAPRPRDPDRIRVAGFTAPETDGRRGKLYFETFSIKPFATLQFTVEYDPVEGGFRVLMTYVGNESVGSIVWITQKTPFDTEPGQVGFDQAVADGNFRNDAHGIEIPINDGNLLLPGESLYYRVRVFSGQGGQGDHTESFAGVIDPMSVPEVEAIYYQVVAIPDHSTPVQIPPSAAFAVYGTDTEVRTIQLSEANTEGATIVSYNWDFGDGTISHDPEPVHTYQDTGPFYITLTVEDSYGVVSSETVGRVLIFQGREVSKDRPHTFRPSAPQVPLTGSSQTFFLPLSAADNTATVAATRRLTITTQKFRPEHVGYEVFLDIGGGITTVVTQYISPNTVVVNAAVPDASGFNGYITATSSPRRFGYAVIVIRNGANRVTEVRGRVRGGGALGFFRDWETIEEHPEPNRIGIGRFPTGSKVYLIQTELTTKFDSFVEWEVFSLPPIPVVGGYHVFDYDLQAEIKGTLTLNSERKPVFHYSGDEDTQAVAWFYSKTLNILNFTKGEADAAIYEAIHVLGQTKNGSKGTITAQELGNQPLKAGERFQLLVRPYSVGTSGPGFDSPSIFAGEDFYAAIEAETYIEPVVTSEFMQETRATGPGGALEEWGRAEIDIYDPDEIIVDFEAAMYASDVPYSSVTFYSYTSADPDSPFISGSFDSSTKTWSFVIEGKLHESRETIVRWLIHAEFPAGVQLARRRGQFVFDIDKRPNCTFTWEAVWNEDEDKYDIRVDWQGDEDTKSVKLELDYPIGGSFDRSVVINQRAGTYVFDQDMIEPLEHYRVRAQAFGEVNAFGKGQTVAFLAEAKAPLRPDTSGPVDASDIQGTILMNQLQAAASIIASSDVEITPIDGGGDPDSDTVYWTAGTIHLSDGSSVTVAASNSDAANGGSPFSGKFYLYITRGQNNIKATSNPQTAVSGDNILVAVCKTVSAPLERCTIVSYLSEPYISAQYLDVFQLSAVAAQTGSLTVDDVLTVGAGGSVRSDNYVAGVSGWMIGETGAEFNDVTFRGVLDGVTGSLGALNVEGKLTMGPSGEITNASGDFSITDDGIRIEPDITGAGNSPRMLRFGDYAVMYFYDGSGGGSAGLALGVGMGTNANVGIYADRRMILQSDQDMILESINGDVKIEVGTTQYNVWHAGNDGPGSGLDADLLDGVHLSAITQWHVGAYGGAPGSGVGKVGDVAYDIDFQGFYIKIPSLNWVKVN